MRYLEVTTPKECKYRTFEFDDPNDDFSMDYFCRHPENNGSYCTRGNDFPNNCPLRRD